MTSCYATYQDGRIKIIADGLYPNGNGEYSPRYAQMTIVAMQDPEQLADDLDRELRRQYIQDLRDDYKSACSYVRQWLATFDPCIVRDLKNCFSPRIYHAAFKTYDLENM